MAARDSNSSEPGTPPSDDEQLSLDTSTLQYAQVLASINDTGCLLRGALPVPLAFDDVCLPGWYCPRSSAEHPPQMCPPTVQCTALRTSRRVCKAQGQLEPTLCNTGSYCPSAKSQLDCPKGYYCPRGADRPIKCSPLASCDTMSTAQREMLPLIFLVLLDAVLFTLYAYKKWFRRRQKGRHTDDVEQSDPSAPAWYSRWMSAHQRLGSSASETPMEPLYMGQDMQSYLGFLSRAVQTKELGLSFDFANFSHTTKKGECILQGVSGSVPRGTMLGVLGGSGAGKSTLINVILGRLEATTGVVRINGWPKDMRRWNKLIGYVPQDDIVLPELTVRENILHSARMRLPSSWNDATIQVFADSIVSCLSLSPVQDMVVGDVAKPMLSGGQRKRVSIGLELAAAPMAFVLDEPTSGLDAGSAASIMRLLKAISNLGITVISIVHQPRQDIFDSFDQVMLLAHGHQVYMGPTRQTLPYFEDLGYAFRTDTNTADQIMDIITASPPTAKECASKSQRNDRIPPQIFRLVEHWREHGRSETNSPSIGSSSVKSTKELSITSSQSTLDQDFSLHETLRIRGASWPAAVYYCTTRALLQTVRNKSSFVFEILVGGVAGVVIGLSTYASKGHLFQGLYHPPFTGLSSAVDYQGVLQMALLSAMAIGLASSAPGVWVFGEEQVVFAREASSGHRQSAYYVGKVISTIPRIALSSLHYTVFLNILSTPLMSFGDMYAANFMYFYAIYGGASVVSLLVKREDGPLLAVLASLIIGVLGGVAPPLSKVQSWHLDWLWRMGPSVWYCESFWTRNVSPLGHVYLIDNASKTVGFTLNRFSLDIAMIFVIGSVYRIIAFGILKVKRRWKS